MKCATPSQSGAELEQAAPRRGQKPALAKALGYVHISETVMFSADYSSSPRKRGPRGTPAKSLICGPWVPAFTGMTGKGTKICTLPSAKAGVEWHPGELYPRVGFIITNLARPAARVVAFYNQRGTCEQFIKEGKGAIK